MVDVHLAFNKLLLLGVEIRLAPDAFGGVDIILFKYWDGKRYTEMVNVKDFLVSGPWLKKVVTKGNMLADIFKMKGSS